MQRGRLFFILAVAVYLVTLSWAPARAQAPSDSSLKNPFTGNAEAIATGKALFEATCAGYCHATESAKRNGRCPNLFDCEWKHGSRDGEVFHTVTEGVPRTEMVGFKGKLPDEILWKIITYLRSASQCQDGNQPVAAH